MNDNFLWNLRNIRKERGMKQDDLAELLGVTKQTISSYEKGVSFPSMETLKKMPNVLNVTAEELFGFSTQDHLKKLYKVIQEKVKITAEAEVIEYERGKKDTDCDKTITKATLSAKEEELKQKFINDISLEKMNLHELAEIHDYIYKREINKLLTAIEKDEKDNYKDFLTSESNNSK